MYLIYTDESGKSFAKNREGIFTDGPFFLYGGIAINFNQYDILEEAFKDICNEILNIKNIYEKEIHAGKLFKGKGDFEEIPIDKRTEFFKEVIYLLHKFNTYVLVGVTYKDAKIFGDIKNEDLKIVKDAKLKLMASSIYSFFYISDFFLSSQKSKGIIISDELSDKPLRNIKTLFKKENLTGKKEPKLDLLMLRIFYERLKRFKEESFDSILFFKNIFEGKIYSILDNIHFVNSSMSPFIQIADIMLFLLNLYMEYSFLKEKENIDDAKKKLIESIKVPLNEYLYGKNILGAVVKSEKKDVFEIKLKRFEDFVFSSDLSKPVLPESYIKWIIENQANGHMA